MSIDNIQIQEEQENNLLPFQMKSREGGALISPEGMPVKVVFFRDRGERHQQKNRAINLFLGKKKEGKPDLYEGVRYMREARIPSSHRKKRKSSDRRFHNKRKKRKEGEGKIHA